MKHFKDFLYDKNDILIALLILVAAALIIMWRMDAIMAYPQTVFSESGGSDVLAEDDGSQQEGDGQSGDSQSGEGGTQADSDGQAADGNGESGQGTASDALFADGMLTRDVEVNVTGNTAAAAVGCLVDAGLFEDYAEYQQICADTGLDHEKVSAGILTFAKGSTKKDIARKINWS